MSTHLSYEQKKLLFLSALGGVLEYYDFIIYIFLAPFLERLFFASSTPFIAALKTFVVFSIGYLFRPLGGMVFSHFGDRYGRKTIFVLTILFMAIPSFLIAVLPTLAQIGYLAPLTLLFMRILQGLALGGEIPAAITFVTEHSPANKRAFSVACLFFGINIGLLLGSLVSTLFTSLFTDAQMLQYGWRIPFLIGGIFGLIAVYLRRYLRETSAFANLKLTQIERIPILTLLKNQWPIVIQGAFLVALSSVTIILYLYWPSYLNHYFGYKLNTILKINSCAIFILSFSILFAGRLADHFGYRKIYATSAAIIFLIAYPLFKLFTLGSIPAVIISYVCFSIVFGLLPAAYPAILSILFPTSLRYTGIATSYNLAFAFIGLSPTIFTLLIHYYDSTMAPAFYLMTFAMIGFLVCCFGKYKNLMG